MSTVLTRDEATDRAQLIQNPAYEIVLDLTGGGETFGSETVVRFGCSTPGASTFVDFTAAEVSGAVLNGRALSSDALTGDRLLLTGLLPDNTLEVRGRGRYQHTGAGLNRFVDPADDRVYLHTQFEPFDAHQVFVCFDQPDLKAEVTLTVLAPADWVVASNGAESSVAAGECRRWSFAAMPRMSTYLVAVVAGPYQVIRDQHGDVALGAYVRRSLAEYLDADDIFAITKQGLDYFGKLFAFPYPWGKYDQLFVPEFKFGAMENPGCVTFSEGYVFRSKITESMREARAGTILHEMAHMWFGDLVTMRWWDDLWLNESFATYMATRAAVEATRFTSGWVSFASGTKSSAYRQDQLPTTHPISADIVDTDALRLHFDGITYSKGASVLRQLTAWVGTEAFDTGLRDYFARHAFDNADLDDFLVALEKSSGRELGDWAEEWLRTAGVNTMHADFTITDGRYASFTVVQDAAAEQPTLRSHRLGVGLYADSADGLVRRSRVEVDVQGERTEVPDLVGQPVAELLLLNDGDDAYTKLGLDAVSLDTLERRLGALQDPLARSLCWSALWNMVRDSQLPARRFADLVAAHVAAESELTAVQRLLGLATGALGQFADPARREAARVRLAQQVFPLVEAAEPASDAQLTWMRGWLSLLDDADGFARAEALLDGSWSPPGLEVDVDLRWQLAGLLCVRGGREPRVIQEALQRDATDIGQRRATALRAALPDAASKENAWALLVDHVTPLATKRAVAGSLFQYGQEALTRPYAERYFDALPQFWAERGVEEALALTGGLYPAALVEEATTVASARALATGELPALARRVLLEGADGVRRALQARTVDAGYSGAARA